MADRLYLGTRKGFFTLDKKTSGWEISQVDFIGENASMFLQDPRDGALYVSLTLGHFGVKLHRSTDDGQSWEEVAVPVYPEGATFAGFPDESGVQPQQPASLNEIWSLAAGGPDQPNLLWAGTIPGGLFKSEDRGESWQLIESLWDRPERSKWFGGGKDQPGIHSICVNPNDSNHVSIAISCGGVWVTKDGGETWNCMAKGLRADFMPPGMENDPDIQDAHCMVQCAADPDALWIQHHNGIFKTTDGSQNWTEIENAKPAAFGFAVCVHPHDPQTAWFIPGVKDECRVPVDAKLVVSRTSDGGETFEVLRNGLPQEHCYDIVFRHCFDIDSTGNQLAFGSSTGGLWITEDGGENWECVSNILPQIYCLRFAQ